MSSGASGGGQAAGGMGCSAFFSNLQFQIAYPAAKPRVLRCPQSLLAALYDNAVNGKPATVPNPQDLPSCSAVCGE